MVDDDDDDDCKLSQSKKQASMQQQLIYRPKHIKLPLCPDEVGGIFIAFHTDRQEAVSCQEMP